LGRGDSFEQKIYFRGCKNDLSVTFLMLRPEFSGRQPVQWQLEEPTIIL